MTARRRAERAQDTPVALTVATGEVMQNRSVTSFSEVQRLTPALHIAPAALSATTTNLSMRGQVLVDIKLNIDPTVAIYQDGVYLPRAQGTNAADLLDIDRVEVLAGPQGTLYGKNSTGGAVSIYSKNPVDRQEGFVRARYGSFGETAIGAMLNIPLAESAAVRVVGSISQRDGYGDNVTTGERTGKLDSRYIRGALLLKPTEDLTVMLRGDYTKVKVRREAYKGFLSLVAPNTTTGTGPLATMETALELNGLPSLAAFLAQPLATRNAQLAAADTALRSFAQGDRDDGAFDQSSGESTNVWGTAATIDYVISDALSLKSITGYRGFHRKGTQDVDGTPFAIIQYSALPTKDKQFSQETQLNITAFDKRLNGVVGLYYSDEKGHEEVNQISVRVISGAAGPALTIADVTNKSYGVFGQTSFRFTPQFSATAGIRYTKDKRRLIARNRNNLICTALGVPLASIGGAANCVRDMSLDFGRASYTASLEYRPSRDVMLYAKTSRGYRAGGLQENSSGNTPAQADVAFTPFRPETVTDYELGLKSEFFDRRLRLNLVYYHSILDDAIRNVATPVPGSTAIATNAQNAAKAKVDGVEFDITAVPAAGLELGVNGSYTDARFSRYVTPTGEDRTAIPLLHTPKWQVGAVAAYTAKTTLGPWRNQIDMSYTSRQLTAELAAYSPAHTIFNARSSLNVTGPDLDIAVYVKNLTNRRYILFPIDLTSGLGFIYNGLYNPPRSIGLEVTKRF
ncbi:TonB-dependent receptor [Rhizorhabdus sp.]|uniref:TonB-dependent receptor n=1 Tax=Rhizorhabdus sp. TaxID=1968843 RepID=UPI0025DA6A28|nr:TonB-dependent receptor [Rhizorhabdus sp.]